MSTIRSKMKCLHTNSTANPSAMRWRGTWDILDEATTGLHVSDIGHLMQVIDRLLDTGNTVVLIEHNLHVIQNADWIIDLGPEGGSKGGTIMFEGTPIELLKAKGSIADQYL